MSDQQRIKQDVKQRYDKIALTGQNESCCMPTDCDCKAGGVEVATNIEYSKKELESVPENSILGVGCGAPVNFANLKDGEVVVDLGSGAGIDVFLAANYVKPSGKVIGVDMTYEMIERARNNAKQAGFTNVEFKYGDIEQRIPIDDSTVDVVISKRSLQNSKRRW